MQDTAFRRLGFVALRRSCRSSDASPQRELKVVAMPRTDKIARIRLVLHRCHPNGSENLYEQVGLLAVIATEALPPSQSYRSVSRTSGMSSLPTWSDSPALHQTPSILTDTSAPDHLFASSLSPLRAKYASSLLVPLTRAPSTTTLGSAPALASPATTSDARSSHANPLAAVSSAMSEYEVWIPELQAFQTPLQIATEVQRCADRAQHQARHSNETTASYRVLRDECRHLSTKLAMLQETFDSTSHLLAADDDRMALHEEIDLVVQEFGALGSRVVASGMSDWTTLGRVHSNLIAQSPVAPDNSTQSDRDRAVSLYQAVPDLKQDLHSASWHAREDVVWRVVEYLRVRLRDTTLALQRPRELSADVFAVVKHVLHDSHVQVFVAACSLLHEALRLCASPLLLDSDSIAIVKPHVRELVDHFDVAGV